MGLCGWSNSTLMHQCYWLAHLKKKRSLAHFTFALYHKEKSLKMIKNAYEEWTTLSFQTHSEMSWFLTPAGGFCLWHQELPSLCLSAALIRGRVSDSGGQAALTTLHFFPSNSNTGECFWAGRDLGEVGLGVWLLVGVGVCPWARRLGFLYVFWSSVTCRSPARVTHVDTFLFSSRLGLWPYCVGPTWYRQHENFWWGYFHNRLALWAFWF